VSTAIEWTDETWNPVRGCSIVSKGCTNCYAMKQAHRFSGPDRAYEGLTKLTNGGPVWTGEVRLVPELLDAPLHWRKPRRVFVNSMSDLFHEDVPDEFVDAVMRMTMRALRHQFQILTKRPARMVQYMLSAEERMRRFLAPADTPVWVPWPPPNVWLGVSCEDQATADERIPLLLQTPTAVRFVSAEPLLGPINFGYTFSAAYRQAGGRAAFDWLICGGESGPGARPMHPNWARSLRDQCVAAGVPYFFKQWGEWAPGECADFAPKRTEQTATWFAGSWHFGRMTPRESEETHRDDEPDLFRIGKKAAGRLLDGHEWNEFPRVTP
jgi:protein gp37